MFYHAFPIVIEKLRYMTEQFLGKLDLPVQIILQHLDSLLRIHFHQPDLVANAVMLAKVLFVATPNISRVISTLDTIQNHQNWESNSNSSPFGSILYLRMYAILVRKIISKDCCCSENRCNPPQKCDALNRLPLRS